MATILIRGHSDDVIVIEGDLSDELDPRYCAWGYLHFDDGTVIKAGCDVEPGKGWCIDVVRLGDGALAQHLTPILEDEEHYTDRLQLTGDFKSVRCWSSPDGPSDSDVDEFWDDFRAGDWPGDSLRKAFLSFQE